MGSKLLASLAAFTLISSCSARVISQSAIASVLQDIMSPANTEKAMQIINMAATKANRPIPEMTRVVASNDCGLPARAIIANELPTRAVIARNEMALPGRVIANEMGMPRAVISNDGVVRMISNEPRVYSPEVMYPAQNIRQVVRQAPVNLMDSLVLPKEIYQTVPVALPQESTVYPYRSPAPVPYPSSVPNPYLPVGPPNPYMPVASPMSAMSSSFMSPPIQSKGQFLRKIPIPPPTL